jgi:DNA-binding response OmpR family regulator
MSQSEPKHILLVEDYDPVRQLAAAVLEDHGYRVSTVPGGALMRDFLRTGAPVDAIVLDAITPGENGASLALHAKDLRLPVVMISGSDDIISFAAEHGLQLLRKPFRAEELYTALDKAISSGEFGPAECLLTPLPTTLSAASEQKSGRVPKPDRPHVIGYATTPDLSA